METYHYHVFKYEKHILNKPPLCLGVFDSIEKAKNKIVANFQKTSHRYIPFYLPSRRYHYHGGKFIDFWDMCTIPMFYIETYILGPGLAQVKRECIHFQFDEYLKAQIIKRDLSDNQIDIIFSTNKIKEFFVFSKYEIADYTYTDIPITKWIDKYGYCIDDCCSWS